MRSVPFAPEDTRTLETEGFALPRDTVLQAIQQVETISDPAGRRAVEHAVRALGRIENRSEPHCEYSIVLVRDNQRLVLKQYRSGKLLIQGTAADLYVDVISAINAIVRPDQPAAAQPEADELDAGIGLPCIGIDESGKGDYFGPLVAAAALVDETASAVLTELGVRDSKSLKTTVCLELATKIRQLLPGKFAEIEIAPPRYNELYGKMREEGKNLNDLLAWAHATALETLLANHPCTTAISDQFGNKRYLQARLQERGRKIRLIQTPRAERHVAVAAASILARDRFLRRLEHMEQQYGFTFPRGASATVTAAARELFARGGLDALKSVSKLHFRTTLVVTGK